MTRTVSNSSDVIDSRDVIERIKELEEEREALVNEVDDCRTADEAAQDGAPDADFDAAKKLRAAQDSLEEWDADNGEELKTLQALAEEASGAADWEHGETLIRESYFVDYCQELVQDIGDLPRDIPHYLVIDWEATANNIRQDYSAVDYGGVTYLIRD